jgi:hypothetical protein
VKLLLNVLWIAIVVVVPALGVWVGSSLAAYLNGPVWLACLAGLLLFPVLPLLWEGWARRRRERKGRTAPRFFTTWDRIVFRTLAVNLIVMGVLLAKFPATAFAALSTRGDWFLEGRAGQGVQTARAALFKAARGLEWLYDAKHVNPYEDLLARKTDAEPSPEPAPVATPPPVSEEESAPETEAPREAQFSAEGVPIWPLPPQLHPLVASLPADAEQSIAGVARYIARGESQPWLRIKALHDYVADRVAYDAEAYQKGEYPPQDAETVFRDRRSVCAGYANLLAALGQAAGEDIVVIGGDARVRGSDVTGEGHAWNAARIDGRWTLIDATWDAGHLSDGRFVKEYGTDYLFAPPEVQGVTHFPDEARWQLRHPPLDRGEFFRQPMMRARFYAEGLELLAPDRPQLSIDDRLEVSIRNPRHRFFLGRYEGREGGTAQDCAVDNGGSVAIRCEFAQEGTYRVVILSGPRRYGHFQGVGEIEVQSKGR